MLHIIDSLGLGGAQTILKAYLEWSEDERLQLFSLRETVNPIAIEHGRITIAPSRSRFAIGPLMQLHRLVVREQIEILHCHLFRAQVFGLALKLLNPELALIFHEHGRVVGSEGESRIETWLFRRFLRLAARHVDRFICISSVTRDGLVRIVGEVGRRGVVINNPISDARLPSLTRIELRRQFGIPEDVFVLGFAARLVARKGWSEFIEAIARLGNSVPVFFLIAGDGDDRERLRTRISELGLVSLGRVLGHVADMSSFYAALDCFIAPAHWEPHGLSHLEAQSYGVPVIVSDVPGLKGTVHNGVDALLCRPGDAVDLATQISRICTEPALRAQLVRQGLSNVSNYSLSHFAHALDAVYCDVCGTAADSGGNGSPRTRTRPVGPLAS